METLLAQSVELAEQVLVPTHDDMVIAGQTRLMGVQELADLDRLRELFEAFARKLGIVAASTMVRVTASMSDNDRKL